MQIDIQDKFTKIFSKELKLNEKQKKLQIKYDKLYKKKAVLAFELYQKFIENNKYFDYEYEYYNLYIENGYFTAEELLYIKTYQNFVEFRHKSIYRQTQRVNLPLDIKQEYYESNHTVIDKNQFEQLSKKYKIKIRE